MIVRGGRALRNMRLQLGFTLSDVAGASQQIAASKGDLNYSLSPSRLSDIESKGIAPSIFKFYTLAIIYRTDLANLLGLYGVDLEPTGSSGLAVPTPRSTHLVSEAGPAADVWGFDTERTQRIEALPRNPILSALASNVGSGPACSYGYIGSEDWTMHPLLPPGTFVQIDESKYRVAPGPFRSEYERPIYFVETRDGFVCSWCSIAGRRIQLVPHQQSHVSPRLLLYPKEATIVGRVVGMARTMCRIAKHGHQSSGSDRPDDSATLRANSSMRTS